MKQLSFFLFLLASFVTSLSAQSNLNLDTDILERVKPSSVAWTWDDGVYHSKDQEPHTVYLLMNTGGVGELQLSKNFTELIKSWMFEHPDAEAIVTNTINGVTSRQGWTFKPVLVRDGEQMLNVYLVRKGACRANTMALSANRGTPLSSEQVKAIHKKLYEGESLAFKEKLGIGADSEAR